MSYTSYDTQRLSFCTIAEVVLLYQSTVKVILSVLCGEYISDSSRQHDDISGENGAWGKTEHQGTAAFCRVIGSLLLGPLRSQFHQWFGQ